jgi:uncharacterized protein (TIGR03643 family)
MESIAFILSQAVRENVNFMIQINEQYGVSEVIEMAWCDKTSFDDIHKITGLAEPNIIRLMRKNLKPSSFRLWRKRVTGRNSKHRIKTI